jgi:transcriptional regulator with XRE-family HTH domain
MPSTPKLPSPVQRELRRIGDGIKTARLRRGMSQEELGERAGVTFHTVRAMEQGRASTGIGHYLNALWVLGLLDTAGSLAEPALDREGLTLEAAARRRRSGSRRGARRGLSNDF